MHYKQPLLLGLALSVYAPMAIKSAQLTMKTW